jgi:hemolysin activation/secretion protein
MFLLAVCVCFLHGIAFAQPEFEVERETVHQKQLWERYRVERQIQQSQELQPGVQISSPQLDAVYPVIPDDQAEARIFKLNQIVFDNPPQSISSDELQEIADRYIARDGVSIRDIYDLIAEVDRLFDERHVVGRAVIPVQDVTGGVLRIQVIEARIGEIKIEGKRQKYPFIDRSEDILVPAPRPLRDFFVRSQIRSSSGDPLSVKKLEEEVLRYDRLFRSQLLAELEPGEESGTSNLKLTVVEPPPVTVGFFADNSGRETSGKYRGGTFAQFQSLLGLDESLFVSFDKTKGNTSWFVAGEMPITPWGTSLELSFNRGEPETIYGDYKVLDITGVSERYRLGLRQNLINMARHKIDAVVAVESYKSTTWFDDVTNYKEKLLGYTLGLDGIHYYEKASLFSSLSFSGGNAGVAGRVAFGDESYDYSNFSLLRGSLTHVWELNPDWTWVGRLNGQLALSSLPQSQVFQIGGMATVRGTPEGLMSAESGYVVSGEIRYLLFRTPLDGRFDVFGFWDHGGVFYRESPSSMDSSDYLMSVGAGVTFIMGKHLAATVGFGQPIFREMSHQERFKKELDHGLVFFTVRLQF